MSTGATLVVGTAGHVDHGKTTLIRALTGVDLDTRPEEQARGITIALGFVPFDLPDGRRVAFVDVPGHERLVRTMVAGATGLDAVMLCVSAQDGVMPQTREHLAILSLLGLSQGIIVITKADLVDEEMLELAMEDVQDAVAGTFLQDAPVVPVSAVAPSGLDTLTEHLQAVKRRESNHAGPFRLPVDRSFSRAGFGTVATGTAWSGTLNAGETVTLLPSGATARVRGLQTHGEHAEEVRAGWRVAVNLSGVDLEAVPRGTVLSTGDVPVSSMIDVELRVLADAPELEDGVGVRFLLGTAEETGKIHLAGGAETLEPGSTLWAQVRLDQPVATLPGDRFVLRRTSPVQTLGGGVVVDPWAPRLRRKRTLQHADEIERLGAGDVGVWLERAAEQGLPIAEWHARPGASDEGIELGGRQFAASVITRLEGILIHALGAFHKQNPLLRGAGRRELRRDRLGHLDERVFDGLVSRLAAAKALEIAGSVVREPGFEPRLSAEQIAAKETLMALITAAGLGGLTAKKVYEAVPGPHTEALLHLLEHQSLVVSVPSAGWIHAEPLTALRASLVTFFESTTDLDPPAFKELTGLSRRVAIPLLEWMDVQGWTRR
ncbi:MAG: selenocysteine-specific translation elongation factor, partial [Myxococcota bacterium]